MSVDVPVALLGYGTVGCAVARLLADSAEDIERATGHRLRLVRALVRDVDKEREFQPEDGVLTTDFALIRDDESIAVVAEVMGGLDAHGRPRSRAAAGREAGDDRQQAAARPARHGALRRSSRGGCSASLRGPVCAAIPVIKVLREALVDHERPPRARDRQRDDELHPDPDGGRRDLRRTRSRTRSGWATPRPIRRRTCPAQTRRRRWRSSRASRSGHESTLDDVDVRGDRRDPTGARRGCSLDRHGRAARRHRDTRRRRVDVRVRPSLVDRHHPLAAIEGAFNAVMLHGRRDPRGHAGRPRRRRDRDGLGGDGGHGQRRSERRAPASSRATRAGARCERCRPAICRSPFYVRIAVDDRPGVLAHVAERFAEDKVSVARLIQHRSTARPACTSSRMRPATLVTEHLRTSGVAGDAALRPCCP